MMKVVDFSGKLIRDKYSAIAREQGWYYKTSYVSDDERQSKLITKLVEEAVEFQESKNPEELADLLEVIYCIAESMGVPMDEIEQIRVKKNEKKGSFKDGLILHEMGALPEEWDVGRAAILTREHPERGTEILLGQSNKSAIKGMWILPGGKHEEGETADEALLRELREELGPVEVSIGDVLLVKPHDERKRFINYHSVSYIGGEPQPSEELMAVQFFTRDELAAKVSESGVTEFCVDVLKKIDWLD